jgi:serine/threonine protein kinase
MLDAFDDDVVTDLDEYTMLGELGRGGSAIVYRARDRELLRDVAIKVVRPRFAAQADEAIERLAREARTVARLQHPNIVTVHAVKRLRDGGLALVMQLVPGRTLKQAIQDDGPFSPERAERVLRELAEALAFAHAHGVVHRDVKPENVFLDAETDRAMLSDFGIAHSAEFDSRLTMTGAAIGTPAYMAPEQIDGGAANVRSDLYSLGLLTWEMLTGERPSKELVAPSKKVQIDVRLDTRREVVSQWRQRFFKERLAGLEERTRPGRPRVFPPRAHG